MTQTEALKKARELVQRFVDCDGISSSDYLDVRDAIDEALAQPEQEPVAWMEGESVYWHTNPSLNDWIRANGTPLYTTPPQRKPQFKEFIKWAGAKGYDCAQTCNSDTGEWIVLNPMTADLWKAWQAAHGIKE